MIFLYSSSNDFHLLWLVRIWTYSVLYEGFLDDLTPEWCYHGNCCHASGTPGFLLKQLSASQEYNYICVWLASVSLPFSLLLSFSPLNEFSSQINTNDPPQFTDTETECTAMSSVKTSIQYSCYVDWKYTSLFSVYWITLRRHIQKNEFTDDLQILMLICCYSISIQLYLIVRLNNFINVSVLFYFF